MSRALPLLLLVACAEPLVEPPPAPGLADNPERTVQVDPWIDGGASVAWLDGGRVLVNVAGTVQLYDPRTAGPDVLLTRQAEVRGGAWLGEGELLVATEQGLSFWDGELWPTPLQDRLAGPVADLIDVGRARWIRDEVGWHYVTDTEWSTPTVGGSALTQELVPTSPWSAWVRQGDDLVELTRIDGGWESGGHGLIEGLRDHAVDGTGHVWATEGLDLHVRGPAGTWAVHELPEVVAQVQAHPHADGVWVQTVGGTYFGDAEGLAPVEVPDGWWLGTDRHGGLVVRTQDGLSVARTAPVVSVLDLPTSIEETTTVPIALDLQPLQRLQRVRASIDDTPVALTEQAPYTLTIDGSALGGGPHVLGITATWDDGSESSIQTAFVVEGGLITWRDHVQRVFQDHCQVCHGGSADTVLETPQDWQDNIDLILEQVEQARMPLGDDPLPAYEIALIRAWKDGGFP